MTRERIQRVLLLLVVATTIGCDQVTKHVATAELKNNVPHSYLGDTLRLVYAENPGAFLSLGIHWPTPVRTAVFSVWTGIVLALVGASMLRRGWSQSALLGLALLWAGGVSNLVDRVTRGQVVDFMNVGIGSIRTGIFNVADVAIMVGMGLLVVRRKYTDAKRTST